MPHVKAGKEEAQKDLELWSILKGPLGTNDSPRKKRERAREFSLLPWIHLARAFGFSCHRTGSNVCCPRWFGINFAARAAFLSMHCAPQGFLNIIHCVSSYKRNSCCRKLGEITNTAKKKPKTPQSPITLRVCSFLALFLCIAAWFYMIPGKCLIHGKCSRNIDGRYFKHWDCNVLCVYVILSFLFLFLF